MPFQVPERVPWFRVAQALNVKFKSLTGRALTEDNLRFLAEKAFRFVTLLSQLRVVLAILPNRPLRLPDQEAFHDY